MSETEFLKLPLDLPGHVRMQDSIREGFELIDKFAKDANSGSGSPTSAAEVSVVPPETYSSTNLQDIVDELAVKIAAAAKRDPIKNADVDPAAGIARAKLAKHNVTAITAADAIDGDTAATLANELKLKLNALISAA